MSEIDFDLTIRFPDFELRAAYQDRVRVLAITGRSGIGKTSLLNALAGLLTPAEGEIVLNGKTLFDSAASVDVPAYQRHIGYVFQDARLFPHLSVARNLDYAAYLARHRKALINREDLVGLLGLDALLGRYPQSLSGGEQQRVAIARALLSAPDLLLLDEPLSASDKARRDAISTLLLDIKRDIAVPMILVSHNAEDIARLSDAILPLDSDAG